MRAKNALVDPTILTTCTSVAFVARSEWRRCTRRFQCGGTHPDFNIRRREMGVLMMRAFFQEGVAGVAGDDDAERLAL